MLEWLGSIVAGGWNAVDNITNQIGTELGEKAYSFTSSFFPSAQRTIVESDFALPRENQGLPFRPVAADAPSMIETAAYNAQDWLNTPYEEQFSIPAKRIESQQLAANVSGESPGWLSNVWSGFKTALGYHPAVAAYRAGSKVAGGITNAFQTAPIATETKLSTTAETSSFDTFLQDVYNFGESTFGKVSKIMTLGDQFIKWGEQLGIVSPRQTTIETPNAGYPEGENLQHLDWLQSNAASVFETVKQTGAAMLGQLSGLFNLAYEGSEGPQPVFTIQHELEPSKKTSTVLIIAAVVLVIVLLIRRKK